MSKKIKDITKMEDKTYLAKDFSSFKRDLVRYAKNYFADQNADFSEASLGGMFVELASYVGDSMSFYLDHQYNELNPETAVEQRSILAHAQNAGVKILGASPASTDLSVFIEVGVEWVRGVPNPASTSLPVLLEGSTFKSTTGVTFTTTEDLDFSEKGPNDELLATVTVATVNSAKQPLTYILEKTVQATSGTVHVESFSIGKSQQFKKIQLSQINVSEIISVFDAEENRYYEVDFLTQNTAFKKTKNFSADMLEVPSILEVVNAARRFTSRTNFNSGITTLTFGGGDESLPDNDAIPDPSELALPLYGRTTFQRFAIDPQNLIKTQTLGIAPANTLLTITYRAGGGISHNCGTGEIQFRDNIKIRFPSGPAAITSTAVANSLDVLNKNPATGGLPRMGISDIRTATAASRNQQARIVTQDDLLARVYSLPLPFGRVYRAAIRKSSRNPLASELYVISKNRSEQLVVSSDTLKRNLSVYLNEYRLISDAIDVLDVTVINYGVEFSVVTTPDANKNTVVASVTNAINAVVGQSNYQIDQPLIQADFINAIINTTGVLSLNKLEFFNRSGGIGSRLYSDYPFDLQANTFKGMIVGPPGSIFELKYLGSDILGSAE